MVRAPDCNVAVRGFDVDQIGGWARSPDWYACWFVGLRGQTGFAVGLDPTLLGVGAFAAASSGKFQPTRGAFVGPIAQPSATPGCKDTGRELLSSTK